MSNENFLDFAVYHLAADAASIRISRALECFCMDLCQGLGLAISS